MRLAYLVDGPMARGRTGSGHHIRNLYAAFRELGVDVVAFDARTGGVLELAAEAPQPAGSRPASAAQLGPPGAWRERVPERVRRALEVMGARRRARIHLREVGAFLPEAFEPLCRFAPDFVLHRIAHANTFVAEAQARLGFSYGLECNAPIVYQRQHYGVLADPAECLRREERVVRGACFAGFVSDAVRRICWRLPAWRELPTAVIRNAADESFFSPLPGRPETRAELGIAPEETLVVYVGSFKRWHRLDLLLDAARRLEGEPVRFLLVGSGPAERALRGALQSRALAGRVQAIGAVPHEEVPRYLAAADVGVQAGTTSYCAPLKLVEYMAASLPIVAPRVAAIEEILRDDREAALFRPHDAAALADRIRQVHRDGELRRRIALNARRAAENFTWRAHASGYLACIASFGARSKPSARLRADGAA